jgi:hypothetical protein
VLVNPHDASPISIVSAEIISAETIDQGLRPGSAMIRYCGLPPAPSR